MQKFYFFEKTLEIFFQMVYYIFGCFCAFKANCFKTLK